MKLLYSKNGVSKSKCGVSECKNEVLESKHGVSDCKNGVLKSKDGLVNSKNEDLILPRFTLWLCVLALVDSCGEVKMGV